MKKTLYFILSLILFLLLFVPASGAETIAPELDLALSQAGPDDMLRVIVTLKEQATLNRELYETRHERRVRWIKKLRQVADATQPALVSVLRDNRASDMKSLWLINGMSARIPAKAISTLALNPAVKRLQLDFPIPLSEPAPITTAATPQWNISMVNAPELWALGFRGQGVVVATLDTGVDPLHPDLADRWRGGANSWYDPNDEHSTPYDAEGHGTSVTGVMLGGDAGGSSIGMAPDARWIAAKIFDDNGDAWLSGIHSAFQWMLDPDENPETDDAPDIVNNSWGYESPVGGCVGEFSDDIAVLKEAGIAVVFSAGNTGPDAGTSISPANNAGAMAVGSVNSSMTISTFSAAGPSACDGSIFPHLVAPGEAVRSSALTNDGANLNSYATVYGTSFSAPTVSGAMALLISAVPEASLEDLETALLNSAVDLGPTGPDNDYGYGLLDVQAAYELLAEAYPTPTSGPAAPSNLSITVTSSTNGSAKFIESWTDNSDNETGFTLQNATDPDFTTGVNTYTYAANRSGGAQIIYPSTAQLYYRIQAFNDDGVSDWVNATPFPASLAAPTGIPAAPSNLSITVTSSTNGSAKFIESWTDNSDNETGFTLQNATDPDFTTGVNTYTYAANRSGGAQIIYPSTAQLYYRIQAFNDDGVSDWVNATPFPASLAAPTGIPAAPTNFQITASVYSTTQAKVVETWADNADNETGFTMQRASDSNFTQNLVTYSYSADRVVGAQLLSRNVMYYYRLRADGAEGSSDWVNATPFPITTP